MIQLSLKASDGKRIAADIYNEPVDKAEGYIVYTHMMPATKDSWEDLAGAFEKLGYIGIAIDLRGHGNSDGGPDGYKSFGDEEHQAGIHDIETAAKYLESTGARPENIAFVGASIGANLSLKYVSDNQDYKTAVLLSAGLNYYGVETEPLVKKLQPDQRILFATSRDDRVPHNTQQNEKLFSLVPRNTAKKIIIYERAGHGTDMFQTDEEPNLKEELIEFIKHG